MKLGNSTMFSFSKLGVLGVVLIMTLLAVTQPSSVAAQEMVFSDDFSGDLSKWQPVRDDGSMWQIINGAVEATVTKGSTITELVPKDQYWNTEWKNLTFSYDFTPLQGVDRNTSFGWESLKRWFEIHWVNGLLHLVRVEDGQQPFNVFDDYQMVNGQTYHVEITLHNTDIIVKINGEVTTQASYRDYVSQGGKIGLKAGTGSVYPTKVRYDNVKVSWNKPATDTQLSVPLFKQIDPLWATTTYNHATAWSSQPTMSRWGCLVSSIAMVMNYHGITKMADNTPITPASLNDWLTNQPDGYIGSGLVNWSAVTRLTKHISDSRGTPKLEYTRIAGDALTTTIDFIKGNKPSILEVTGHFLVGTGFTQNQQDLLINDPAYSYTKLSQHTTPLKSTRLLTPSHTDLSYLLVAHDPELAVNITNADGSAVTTLEEFTEQLAAAPDHELTTSKQVKQIAKPESMTLDVKISQPQVGPFKLTIFAYDRQANLTDLSLEGWVGPEQQIYTINYQKDGSSSLEADLSFSYLRQVLAQLNSSQAFLKGTTYGQFDSIAAHGEQESTTKQLQRVKQLRKVMSAMNKWLTPQSYQYLSYILNQLEQKLTT
jgi:hypothetical protein